MNKICFVSSSGGHWEELMCLREIADSHPGFFVTEAGEQAEDFRGGKLYQFRQINRRELLFPFHFLWVLLRALWILLRERPRVVITTGALISYPFCLWGKLLGSKIIYIESFARVYNRSLTGRLVYPFADLFVVQWETMLECYPRAICTGPIF